MASTTSAPVGGDAAAAAVAAKLDRIAEQSSRAPASGPAAQPSPAAVPAGPSLEPGDWVARVLRLIDGLRSPSDTQPAQVAQALGLALAQEGSEHVARGALAPHGGYTVWVNVLYREHPDKWTVGLAQDARPGQTGCLFPLATLRQHLSARGYSANEGVRQRDGGERALYRSAPTPEGIVFVVSAQLAPGGTGCIEEVRVNANTREDET
ncbi:hypothetical protein [Lysobacter capsici]|uniref:hypothetical protein n=1 Tax=Lysobacter capsici TaxID=435897 RepID=UPI001C00448B|nr:hypothetical protein [Lysobacter capsici]QWF18140.1 hypothetical protein KME82_05070 [Lysobacter capsici]